MTARQLVALILVVIAVYLLTVDTPPAPVPPKAAVRPKPQADKIIEDDYREQKRG